MQINFYATLRQVVGAKTVEVSLPEGATIRELIAELIRCYPALQQELLDEQGELYQHVHIFVDGRDAPFLENGLDTTLSKPQKVGIFPAVGGGALSC
jgi:sulfur-carrier protein